MIKARRPLLVFSRVSSTMMRPSLLLLLSALATKTGVGGKKQPLLPMPPPPIEEFPRPCPGCNVYVDRAVCDGLTDVQGRRQGGSPINDDDDDNGGGGGDDDDDNNNGWGRRLDSRWGWGQV
jgi:hypothetical protein